MARYPLIMKDQTYITIVKYGASLNPPKSPGKIINEVLNDWASKVFLDGGQPAQAICIVCGRKATVEAHGQGQQKFMVCPNHKGMARKVRGWKNLAEEV